VTRIRMKKQLKHEVPLVFQARALRMQTFSLLKFRRYYLEKTHRYSTQRPSFWKITSQQRLRRRNVALL